MATTYIYNDTFIIDSVELDTLEAEEAKAIEQVAHIGIEDSPYIEQLVMCILYKALCAMQLEDSGFQEKFDIYSREFDRYYNLAITDSPANISTVPIGRG